MMMAPSAAETIQRADQTVSVKVTYKQEWIPVGCVPPAH